MDQVSAVQVFHHYSAHTPPRWQACSLRPGPEGILNAPASKRIMLWEIRPSSIGMLQLAEDMHDTHVQHAAERSGIVLAGAVCTHDMAAEVRGNIP